MKADSEDKIIELLLGELSENEVTNLRAEIEVDPELKKEFETYQQIWKSYRELPMIKGEDGAIDRFDAWLGDQSNRDSKVVRFTRFPNILKYGAVASLIMLVGWFLINQYTSDTNGVNTNGVGQGDLLQFIAAESPTSRIKAINRSLELEADPKVIDALIKLLLEDESSNVRLVALEGLLQYAMNDRIKEGLLEALENEKQPVVQISIINALVGLGDDRIKPKFEGLIESAEIQPFVKDEVRLGLTRL